LVGFLQAQKLHQSAKFVAASGIARRFDVDYYRRSPRFPRSRQFHMAFFDDRLAMPDRYGSDHAHTVENAFVA